MEGRMRGEKKGEMTRRQEEGRGDGEENVVGKGGIGGGEKDRRTGEGREARGNGEEEEYMEGRLTKKRRERWRI